MAIPAITEEDASKKVRQTLQGVDKRVDENLNAQKTGADVAHDSEGGYNNCDVNGTKTKVYTKYFSGSLDGSGNATVAHGLTAANILSCVVAVRNTSANYFIGEGYLAASASSSWLHYYDATNVIIDGGSGYASEVYRIRIDYII